MEPKSYLGLLDPREVARIDQLEVIASHIVEGLISGKHRSPFKGSSVEFAEHRAYTPGDDLRTIDWHAYAKTDRYYIKLFEEQTNLRVMLVVDASGSMGFSLGSVSKFRYAQMSAACLARLMLRQRDAVGLTIVNNNGAAAHGNGNGSRRNGHLPFYPPRSRTNYLHVLLQALSDLKPHGEGRLGEALHSLASRFKRRGMVIVCSDCFDDVEEVLKGMRHLRSQGHEVLLLHIMAPEEMTFNFEDRVRFENLEIDGQFIEVDAVAVREDYLANLRTFLDRLRRGCGEIGVDYYPIATSQPLGETLAAYLSRRQWRRR